MLDDVIDRVNKIGRRQKARPGPLLTNRFRQPIETSHVRSTLEEQMDDRYGPRSNRHNLRPRRAPSYGNRASYPGSHGHVHATVDGTSPATPQMSMKKGLKMFGTDGADVVRSELQQLHDRSVMHPRLAS
jgi:hypothetical protein